MAEDLNAWFASHAFADDTDDTDLSKMMALTPPLAPGGLDLTHHATSSASSSNATFAFAGPVPSGPVPIIPADPGGGALAEGYATGLPRFGRPGPAMASSSASASGRTVRPGQRADNQYQHGQTLGQVAPTARSSAYHPSPSPIVGRQAVSAPFDWSSTGDVPLFGAGETADDANYFDIAHLKLPRNSQSGGDSISPSIIHSPHHAHFPLLPTTVFNYPVPCAEGSDAGLQTETQLPDRHYRQPNPWLDPPRTDSRVTPLDGIEPKTEIPAAMGVDDDMLGGESLDSWSAPPRRKRARNGPATAQTSSSSASSTSESKLERKSSVTSITTGSTTAAGAEGSAKGPGGRLRTAPRTTKTNTRHKPPVTAEERRTRASHNIVEKKYRNRLNAQFESLLNALPEQVRRGGGGAGGDDDHDDDDNDEDDDVGPDPNDERRLSKAEVLDKARRHILSLERERDAMQREKAELLKQLDQLG